MGGSGVPETVCVECKDSMWLGPSPQSCQLLRVSGLCQVAGENPVNLKVWFAWKTAAGDRDLVLPTCAVAER